MPLDFQIVQQAEEHAPLISAEIQKERLKHMKAHLRQIYSDNNKDKLSGLDRNFDSKYKNREVVLYDAVCNKYKVAAKPHLIVNADGTENADLLAVAAKLQPGAGSSGTSSGGIVPGPGGSGSTLQVPGGPAGPFGGGSSANNSSAEEEEGEGKKAKSHPSSIGNDGFGPFGGKLPDPTPPPTTKPNFSALIHELYAQHNKEKLKELPKLMEKYQGQEDEL